MTMAPCGIIGAVGKSRVMVLDDSYDKALSYVIETMREVGYYPVAEPRVRTHPVEPTHHRHQGAKERARRLKRTK